MHTHALLEQEVPPLPFTDPKQGCGAPTPNFSPDDVSCVPAPPELRRKTHLCLLSSHGAMRFHGAALVVDQQISAIFLKIPGWRSEICGRNPSHIINALSVTCVIHVASPDYAKRVLSRRLVFGSVVDLSLTSLAPNSKLALGELSE